MHGNDGPRAGFGSEGGLRGQGRGQWQDQGQGQEGEIAACLAFCCVR